MANRDGIPSVEARRTLVKSPPELWAELSDPTTLGRHLEDFGEIRITWAQTEALVVWEGDRASGRVELVPSGWGTRVTLVAEPVDEPVAEEQTVSLQHSNWRSRMRRKWRRSDVAGEAVVDEPAAPEPARDAADVVDATGADAPVAEAADAGGPRPPALDAEAVLTAVLDTLGTARHRPFSRA